jgi:hypothetical protein
MVLHEDPAYCRALCRIVGRKYPVIAHYDLQHTIRVAHISPPDCIVIGVPTHRLSTEGAILQSLHDDPALATVPVLLVKRGDQHTYKTQRGSSHYAPDMKVGVVVCEDPEEDHQIFEALRNMIGVNRELRSTFPPRPRRSCWAGKPRRMHTETENWSPGKVAAPTVLTHAPV